MKISMCKVFDSYIGNFIDIGAFSSVGRAMIAGSSYIESAGDKVTLLDWERDENVYTDWYEDSHGHRFTRIVTETELDRSL